MAGFLRLLLERLRRRMSMPAHLRTGLWGEQQAERLLKKKGYRILERRFRVKKLEIDLIARSGDCIVFVEVKTRASELFGRPAASVGRAKRDQLSRAAIAWLRQHKLKPPYLRFDLVEVIGTQAEGLPEIRHIENAFQLSPRYRIRW